MYPKRLQKLKSLIKEERFQALLVTNQTNIFYLCGVKPMPDTKELTALVTQERLFVFVRSTYFQQAKKEIMEGELIKVNIQKKLSDRLKILAKRYKLATIGFESANVTVSLHNNLKKKLPIISWKETDHLVEKLRQIKDDDELENIRAAAKITDEAFSFILKKIKPGRREKDIALELEFFLKTHSDGIAFSPIVASGKNSANPHYIAGEKKLAAGEMVLLDFGAKVNGYCADLTRTVFIGKATKQFKQVYQTVAEAQQRTLNYLASRAKKGLLAQYSTEVVDKVARNYIHKHGYPDIPHGVGHCLGLAIHELPRLAPQVKDKLKPGMVFTIEPGIYLPNWGGVRIEDLVAWLPTGRTIILSKSSKKLIEL